MLPINGDVSPLLRGLFEHVLMGLKITIKKEFVGALSRIFNARRQDDGVTARYLVF